MSAWQAAPVACTKPCCHLHCEPALQADHGNDSQIWCSPARMPDKCVVLSRALHWHLGCLPYARQTHIIMPHNAICCRCISHCAYAAQERGQTEPKAMYMKVSPAHNMFSHGSRCNPHR